MCRNIWMLTVVALIVAGCGNQEELENRNRELAAQLASKDMMIEEVTTTVNEIHNALETAWAMEKNVVSQTTMTAEGVPITPAELKERILDRISDMRATLTENRKKMTDLERRLRRNNTQYAGLQKMVDDLKTNLEAREKSIAELSMRVEDLEHDIVQKAQLIEAHETTIASNKNVMATYESTINDQTKQLNTAYYIAGNRNELEEKGIIRDEGGILWGLAGTTTVLSSDFDDQQFQSFDKTAGRTIQINGEIEEIVPKRDESSYVQERTENGNSVLIIVRPEKFWREKLLVVVTEE
ncbi:MAG: hypothetical protein HYV29_12715 [Ignavibacteriales bacterium]|nr:hypothetical protein [Ignavibacteriales bacterium]